MAQIDDFQYIHDPDAARELHEFAQRLGESISVELTSYIGEAGTGTSEQLAQTISADLPQLLEKHMLRGLLVDEQAAVTRARLAHALSALTLQEFATPDEAQRTARGNTLPNDDADTLTSAEAARLLNVSRTHLNTLVSAGKLGLVDRTEGGHRRISRSAVLAYRTRSRRQQEQAMADMAAASDDLGMYDDELKSIPRRKAR